MVSKQEPVSENRRKIMRAIGLGSIAGLAGCSGGDDGATNTESPTGGEPVDLVWNGFVAPQLSPPLEESMKAFSEKDNNIKAEWVYVPGENYDRTMRTRIGGGNAGDLIKLQPEKTYPPLAKNNHLENLLPYIEDDDEFSLDDFYPGLIESLYRWSEDEIYALPSQSGSIALYYDSEAWEDAGVTEAPETWSEFETTLRKVKDNGVESPYILPFQQSITKLFYQFAWQNGGNITNEDNSECIIASDSNIEALEFINGMVQDGLITTLNNVDAGWYGSAVINRVQGATATAGGPWIQGSVKSAGAEANERITNAPLPKPEGGEQAVIANSHAESINTHIDSNKKDEAFELLKWITKEDVPRRRLDVEESIPAAKGYEDHSTMQNVPEFRVHLDQLEHANAFYFGPLTNSIVPVIVQQLQGVYSGSISAQKGLENAESQINNEVLN